MQKCKLGDRFLKMFSRKSVDISSSTASGLDSAHDGPGSYVLLVPSRPHVTLVFTAGRMAFVGRHSRRLRAVLLRLCRPGLRASRCHLWIEVAALRGAWALSTWCLWWSSPAEREWWLGISCSLAGCPCPISLARVSYWRGARRSSYINEDSVLHRHYHSCH